MGPQERLPLRMVMLFSVASTTPSTDVELEFWRSVKDSNKPEELNAYLSSYPNGQFRSPALARIASLDNGGTPAAKDKDKDMTRNLTAVDPATFTEDSSQVTEDQIGLDRGQRRAGTEVAAHHPQHLDRLTEDLGGPAADIGMRQPVEAVPPQAPPPVPLMRQCVGGRLVRDRRVERGVEAGHCRNIRQQPAQRVDTGDTTRLVQRREFGERGDACPHSPVDEDRLGELGAAVHDPVADDIEAGSARRPVVRGQAVQKCLQFLGFVVAGPLPEIQFVDDLVVVGQQADLQAG